MKFETIACPGCLSNKSHLELEVRDRFNTNPGQIYQIVRCLNCKLLYLNPRPDKSSIADFYAAEGYDPFGSSKEQKSLTSKLYDFARPLSIRRKAARVVVGVTPGCKTLDVGCATGEFMIELGRRGFQTFGVEPDPGAAEYARVQYGLKAWTGTIEDVPLDSGPYGLISFWHVLEHVHDLKGTLEKAHRLLDTNGKLAIAVPNPMSLDARAYGTQWVAWDTPRHLYHFEPEVMMNLLSKFGFRPKRMGAVAFDAFYQSILSETKSVSGFLRGSFRGTMSYLSGISGNTGSSELYIAGKN